MRYLYLFSIWNHTCTTTASFQLLKFIKTGLFISAQFRLAVPPSTAIARLNQNAIVSLDTDIITKEKVEINIRRNPHTLFLATTNRAVNLLNTMAIEILFSKELPLANILDGNRNSMNIYKHMLVVITENR